VLDAAPERTALRVEGLLAAAGLSLRRGDTDAFLQRVDEAVGIYRDLGDPVATAEAVLQHAMLEIYVRWSPRAVELFDEAVATAERLGEDRLAVGAVHAAAILPWFRSDLPGARAGVLHALGRLEALPTGPHRFLQAVTFGMPVLPLGPAGAPRAVWEATLYLFRRLDREEAIVLALNNLAWVARAEGDLDEAAAVVDDALAHAGRTGDRLGEALTLAHAGHLARARGEIDRSCARLQEAIAAFDELGERRDADVTTLGLGLTHGAAGDMAAARAAFARTFERFTASDDSPGIAGTWNNWGIVEAAAGEHERARDLFAGSADAWGAQQLTRFEAWARLGQADALHALGATAEATAVWERTHGLMTALADGRGSAETAARLGAQSALSGCKEGGT
jgi:tetratricopeptide (TPR) repeat protein